MALVAVVGGIVFFLSGGGGAHGQRARPSSALGGRGDEDGRELRGTVILVANPPRNCSRLPFKILIKDGTGTVLRAVEGPTSDAGAGLCKGEYTETVPKNDVYIIEVQRYLTSRGLPYSITVNAADLADDERLPDLSAVLN